MRILLTNDDGIDAEGLSVLRDIAHDISDDIWIVAPACDQSGSSHSLTLKDPLRCRKIDEKIYSVEGTPTDCVIMAVRQLIVGREPDLILSGINCGQNLADDVTYSGTIAGAMEGVMLGIPSIALSLTMGMREAGSVCWQTPRQMGGGIIEKLLQAGWPQGVLMNVNFPDCEPQHVQGFAVTRQGQRDQNLLKIDQRHDPRERAYYWFDFERKKSHPEEGTDLLAIYQNQISITPLHLNLTHEAVRCALAEKLAGSKQGYP